MDSNEKKKGELIDFFTKKSISAGGGGNTVKVSGNGNITAGGNVTVNKNIKKVTKTTFKPGPEHISAAQAKKLQELVEKIVTTEAAAGVLGGERKKLFPKWWGMLKKQYNVATYREIPVHLGDRAIAWMQQIVASNRPKLRKTDNKTWRKDLYSAIHARMGNHNMSKGEVLALIEERLGKKVTSMSKLNDKNLKSLHSIIMAL